MVGTTTRRKSSQIAGSAPRQRASDRRRILRVRAIPRMAITVVRIGHVHRKVRGQPRIPVNGSVNQPTATSITRNETISGQYRGFQRESLPCSFCDLRGPNKLSAARHLPVLSDHACPPCPPLAP